MKKILFAAIAMVLSLGVQAQNATNSPYSQYGYGHLADQSNGAYKAMAGLGIGWRDGKQVNFSNPASYSSIDSLTFLFDAGMSFQVTNFTEGGRKLNANNSSFDYVIGAFRLRKHLGLAFGVMPYSAVGYDYYDENTIGTSLASGDTKTTYTNTYMGDGGFRQVFLGLGYEPLHTKKTSFSIGANAAYVWGNYEKSIVNSYSNAYVNTLSKYYTCTVNAFHIDFGAQLEQTVSKFDKITLGATFAMKQSMHGNPNCDIISTNSQTGVADTTSIVADGYHNTPMTIGLGLVWNHANQWRIGADYKMEKWADVQYPMYSVVNEKPTYQFEDGLFKNRQKFTVGGEFCVNPNSRSWFDRVKIRAGFSYATPYLMINGVEGPKEMSATFGFGLPITNNYNNRSMLNISAGWTQQSAANLIKENCFCINIGFTFNERWFAKWQVE